MAHGPDTDILLEEIARCKHKWYEFWKSEHLFILGMNITSLPALPKYIKRLSIGNTRITELPELPEGLEEIICVRSNISYLPELPNSLNLLVSYGMNTHITIPKLPEGLERLRCDTITPSMDNKITLKEFIENNKNRVQLPDLPKSLKWLSCDVIQPDDMSMEAFIDTIRDWQEQPRSKKRSQERCAAIKEELVATVWHPRRVAVWLEVGALDAM